LVTFIAASNNCGCFGFDDRITWKTIARDGSFPIPALFLAISLGAEALKTPVWRLIGIRIKVKLPGTGFTIADQTVPPA
jgi:hypothetical protein